jgi:hypothetical protein
VTDWWLSAAGAAVGKRARAVLLLPHSAVDRRAIFRRNGAAEYSAC